MDKQVEYRIINYLKHNNDVYMVLFNEKNGIYFLKFNNEKLEFPTVEEYIDLRNTLHMDEKLFASVTTHPYVKVGKKFVSLALIGSILLSTSACSRKVEESVKEENNVNTEVSVSDVLEAVGISVSDGVVKDDNYYFLDGIDFSNPNVTEYIKQKEYNSSFKETLSISEFTKRLGLENISYDDLRNAINENNEFNESMKNALITGINNLESNGFNMDFGVLYYNLKNMKIVYRDDEEFTKNASGQFVPEIQTAYIESGKEIDPYVLYHELLGHGATCGFSKDLEVTCTPSNFVYMYDKESGNINQMVSGRFLAEGIADTVASVAGNIVNDADNGAYLTERYELQYFAALLEKPVSYVCSMNIEELMVELGKKNKLTADPMDLIMECDFEMLIRCAGEKYERYDTLTTPLAILAINYTDHLIESGLSKEEITDKIDLVFEKAKYNITPYKIEDHTIVYSSLYNGSYTIIDETAIYNVIMNRLNDKYSKGK